MLFSTKQMSTKHKRNEMANKVMINNIQLWIELQIQESWELTLTKISIGRTMLLKSLKLATPL